MDYRDYFNRPRDVRKCSPNITGGFSRAFQVRGSYVDGAFASDGVNRYQETQVNYEAPSITFNASRSSIVYDNSTTVQPPSFQILMIIKI